MGSFLPFHIHRTGTMTALTVASHQLRSVFGILAALTASAVTVLAQPTLSPEQNEVVAVVRSFHDALSKGDSTGALNLLSADVRILESGGVETRQHYREGHLAGDIGFARAVPSVYSDYNVVIDGNVAWVTSTSVTSGQMGDRKVNSAGAELMVLSRSGTTWIIRAIHWSSRAIRSSP